VGVSPVTGHAVEVETDRSGMALSWPGGDVVSTEVDAPRSSGLRWVLMGAAVTGFVVLTGAELADRGPAGADSAVLSWMLAHRGSDAVTAAALAVTHSGASVALFPLVALVGLAVGLKTRRWWPGVVALAVAGIGVLSRFLLSTVVRDARPPRADWLTVVHGYSYPSGHTATSALIAGTLAWLVLRVLSAGWARLVVAVALAAWAVLVGLSRLYLGVHWVSDVIGGWLLSAAWLAVLLVGSQYLERRRRRRETPTA
jgi:undecaprenyl-diphosphatase